MARHALGMRRRPSGARRRRTGSCQVGWAASYSDGPATVAGKAQVLSSCFLISIFVLALVKILKYLLKFCKLLCPLSDLNQRPSPSFRKFGATKFFIGINSSKTNTIWVNSKFQDDLEKGAPFLAEVFIQFKNGELF